MGYTPISPVRVLDTRINLGLSGKFNNMQSRIIKIAGTNGIPANATAVAGNLTITEQTTGGYLVATPLTQMPPVISSLNAPVKDNRANSITGTGLAPDGTLAIAFVGTDSTSTTDVCLDIIGYFTP
jgi:hypothetical protein